MKNYLTEVWSNAVSAAKSAVHRTIATPPGGMLQGESTPDYITRTRKIQDEALARLVFAEKKLEEAKLEDTK